jgi:IS5 family transposase
VVEWVAADSAVGRVVEQAAVGRVVVVEQVAEGRVVEQAVAATGGVQSQSTFQRRQQRGTMPRNNACLLSDILLFCCSWLHPQNH